MDKVDTTMAAVNEQRDLANEIADAISNPLYSDSTVDEVRTVPFFSALPPFLLLDA
jgi:hypothetical protein